MALPSEVLSVEAEQAENNGFKKYKINPQQVRVLDALFHQHYMVSRPGPSDYKARTDLIRIFNEIAKEIYGNSGDAPSVVEFGSFLMDLFCAKSDLDLSINFMKNEVEITRQKKIQTLRKFTKKFYALQSKGHVSGVQPVLAAKVPILKVVDRGTRVECDFSVQNIDGILKSQLIRMICSIDERFQILSFLMKAWAKAQNINSSKGGTLNSLSIILLVSFHLQTRKPPILPPFSSLFKDGTDPTAVAKLLQKFFNYGKHNKESVAELFISLLIKLSSVEILWPNGLCASVYNGSWTSKAWDSKIAPFSVEDFLDRAQNVARAVSAVEMKRIHKCIHRSLNLVSSFMDGQFDGSQLAVTLFGKDARQLPPVVANGANMLTRTLTPPHAIPQNIHVQESLRFSSHAMNSSYIPPYPTYHNGAQITQGSQGRGIPAPNTILTKRPSPVDVRKEVPSRNWQNGERFPPLDSALPKRIHYEQTSAHLVRRGHGFDPPKAQPPVSSWGAMQMNGQWVVKQPVTTYGEAQREAGMLANGNGSLLHAPGTSRRGSSGAPQRP